MYRVLKPNGRVAIAVWAQLERNQIAAAFHAALRATVPVELASLMMAPYSWPSGSALKNAAEEASFREIRLLTPTLSMVLEGGLDQAIRSFSATPVSPGVAACTRSFLRTGAARVGPARKRWEGDWRNDFKYYPSQLLVDDLRIAV